MIPLKDDVPRYSPPIVNALLIATNVLVYLFQSSLPRSAQLEFVRTFALVPARLLAGVGWTAAHPSYAHGHGVPLEIVLLPILTCLFLHASFWFHLLPNMWFLWVFGRNVEEALGRFPYLVFYLVCGVTSVLTQTFADVSSTVPMVGASGAIAGVMGGYFVLYPRARVLMLVHFLFIFFLWLPAWAVLGYWFVLQTLSGVGSALVTSGHGSSAGGVDFWAHVGGFLAGVLLVRLFPSRTRRYRYGY